MIRTTLLIALLAAAGCAQVGATRPDHEAESDPVRKPPERHYVCLDQCPNPPPWLGKDRWVVLLPSAPAPVRGAILPERIGQ